MTRYVVVAIINSDHAEIPQHLWSQTFDSENAADKCADWLIKKNFIDVEVFADEPEAPATNE